MSDFERGASGRQDSTSSQRPEAQGTAPGKVTLTSRLPAAARSPGPRRPQPSASGPASGASGTGPATELPAELPLAILDGISDSDLISDDELAAAKIESRLAHSQESTADVLAALAAYRDKLRVGQQPWPAAFAATVAGLAPGAAASAEPTSSTRPGQRAKPALSAVNDAANRLAGVVQEQLAVLERAGRAASGDSDLLAELEAVLQALGARTGLAEANRLEALATQLAVRPGETQLGDVRKQLIRLARSYQTWRTGKAWQKLRARAEKAVRRRKPGGEIDRSHGAPAWRPSRHPDGEPGPLVIPRLEIEQVAHLWKFVRIDHLLDKDLLKTKTQEGFEQKDLTSEFKTHFQGALLATYHGEDVTPFLENCRDALAQARPDLEPAMLEQAVERLREFVRNVLQLKQPSSAEPNPRGAPRPPAEASPEAPEKAKSPPIPAERLTRLRDELDTARRDPATRPLAEEILQAGASWPFGPLHYYERLKVGYTQHGIQDIFAHYRSAFVTYDFFGQQIIEIDRVCVEPLKRAEKLYFTAVRQMGLPATATFQVSPNTAAFNFRGHRQNVQQHLLLDAKKAGLLRHNAGRAIDVNTTGGRNPHVKHDKRIWLPVQAVLQHAGRADLAAIPFAQAGKDWTHIEQMLEASRVYQQHYAAWKQSYPRSLAVPFAHMPTPEELQAALRAQGIHARSPEVVAERQTAAQAQSAAKRARGELSATHARRQRAMSAAARTLRQRLERRLGPQEQERYGAARAMLLQSLGNVDSALASWATALERPTGGADAVDAWRAAAAAVDQAIQGLRQTLWLVEHLFPFQLSGPPPPQAKPGFAHALHALRLALAQGELSGTGIDASAAKVQAVESSQGWVDQTITRPHLTDSRRADHQVQLLGAYRDFRGELERWARQGFVDHPVLFVWAMKQAGWRYGGEYSSPDFHHFEWL